MSVEISRAKDYSSILVVHSTGHIIQKKNLHSNTQKEAAAAAQGNT
jgi:hypothetical protein